ncbi:helix-turn-helix domain-containing protein [Clostridium saccharobutylicum]|uniref:Antitoxin PezA n=1 Tax=Clostridium saccharobutylicum TaxID=169679 RepID=A0A1S8NJT3_CLOSA|nr:helix-turn-helix transcriptional regulator [Clostridium saccharobutylicum]OOM16726.1 antitoxin PezA [Clostridium saccharobutylicum]
MGVNDIIKVGDNIKSLRKEKRISQKDMAAILKIPYSTYSNYENNNREPSAEMLNKIAKALNVNLAYLLGIQNHLKNASTLHRCLPDDNESISKIASIIKLCGFKINFNEFIGTDDEAEESLKIAIENDTIPLVYINDEKTTLNLTNSEFKEFTDKILHYVKFEMNELIKNK